MDYIAGKPEVKAAREAFDASIGKDVGENFRFPAGMFEVGGS